MAFVFNKKIISLCLVACFLSACASTSPNTSNSRKLTYTRTPAVQDMVDGLEGINLLTKSDKEQLDANLNNSLVLFEAEMTLTQYQNRISVARVNRLLTDVANIRIYVANMTGGDYSKITSYRKMLVDTGKMSEKNALGYGDSKQTGYDINPINGGKAYEIALNGLDYNDCVVAFGAQKRPLKNSKPVKKGVTKKTTSQKTLKVVDAQLSSSVVAECRPDGESKLKFISK